MHEINAVATARALVTHLRINGANDTLIDNEERSAPNGDLVKALMFLLISQVCMGLIRSAHTSVPLGLCSGSSL